MIILCMHTPSCVWKQYWEWHAINDKCFGGLKVLRFAGFIRYVGKGFVIFSITTFIATFMVFQPYKTAMIILTKASCSSHGFSLKLSLAYSKWTRVHYWHMSVQISRFPGWPCIHSRRRATVEESPRWNSCRSLTAFKLLPNLLAETL